MKTTTRTITILILLVVFACLLMGIASPGEANGRRPHKTRTPRHSSTPTLTLTATLTSTPTHTATIAPTATPTRPPSLRTPYKTVATPCIGIWCPPPLDPSVTLPMPCLVIDSNGRPTLCTPTPEPAETETPEG